MKKTLVIIITVVLIACILCSCSEKVSISAENGITFNYEQMTILDSFDNYAPKTQGNQILCVTVTAPADTDIDALRDTFFGITPSTVTDGTNTYECSAVAYGKSGDTIVFNALYEIPSGMAKTQFSVNGSFGTFSGTAK